MRQKWRDLLFLHWAWDADAVQATLPAGLKVDRFEGQAYLGIVPFFMVDVHPRFLRPVRRLSNFMELNLRTYVRDSEGRPGVWFYSLDCSQKLAVWVARTFFKLPYFYARMRARKDPSSNEVIYRCWRRGSAIDGNFAYRPAGHAAVAEADSLEEFLIERYRLYSYRAGRLYSGEVWHRPYEISPVKVREMSQTPLALAGFSEASPRPDHAVYSPGVDVEVFALRRIRTMERRLLQRRHQPADARF